MKVSRRTAGEFCSRADLTRSLVWLSTSAAAKPLATKSPNDVSDQVAEKYIGDAPLDSSASSRLMTQ